MSFPASSELEIRIIFQNPAVAHLGVEQESPNGLRAVGEGLWRQFCPCQTDESLGQGGIKAMQMIDLDFAAGTEDIRLPDHLDHLQADGGLVSRSDLSPKDGGDDLHAGTDPQDGPVSFL